MCALYSRNCTLLELGFVIMLDSATVLSVKPLSGLDIFIGLVFFENLKPVRNRYFVVVDEYIVIFEFLALLTSITMSHFPSYLENLHECLYKRESSKM